VDGRALFALRSATSKSESAKNLEHFGVERYGCLADGRSCPALVRLTPGGLTPTFATTAEEA